MSRRRDKRVGALSTAWIEATGEQARAAIGDAGELAADLVAAWIANKNAAAVAAIAADDHAPSLPRKAARRGLNVLKSRGVAIPEAPRAPRGVATSLEKTFEAWFRAPDGGGTSAFTLGVRSEGRYRLVDVIVKAGTGIVSIAGMQISRGQLRDTFDEIEKRFGAPPAPVPIGWARARIALARAEHDTHRTPVPLGFEAHRDLLGPAPSPPPPHPIDAVAHQRSELALAVPRSDKLHAQPELRTWLPEPSAMQRMLIEATSLEATADPAETELKVRAIIERETDRYFTAEVREALAARMKDAAISMLARGPGEAAADLMAMIEVVRGPGSTVPHEIPFLRAFFEKAFGLLTAQMAKRRKAP